MLQQTLKINPIEGLAHSLNVQLDHNILNTFGINLTFNPFCFVLCTYVYVLMFMFLMYCDLHA